MISLLKTFGKGLLYVIGAPFFIVALALFGVIGLGAFIFQIIKSIIYFFTGQSFFPELPEDKKLRLMKEAANEPNEPSEEKASENVFSSYFEEPQKETEPQPDPVLVQGNQQEPTIEETVFEDTSPLQNLINQEETPEPPVEEEKTEEENHTVLETNEEAEAEEETFEELETYIPRSSTYSEAEDDEDSDTESGVNIDYNL